MRPVKPPCDTCKWLLFTAIDFTNHSVHIMCQADKTRDIINGDWSDCEYYLEDDDDCGELMSGENISKPWEWE